MAKKKKKRVVSKKKPAKATAKRRTKKSRKPPVRSKKSYNTKGFKKYREIVSAIRNYYKESGKPISNEEALKIYHESKEQFKDVRVKYLENAVESYLTGKEHKQFPASALLFSWYHLKDALTDHEAVGYFKATDIISLDLSAVDLDNFEFNYNSDLSKEYSELYSLLKALVRMASPPPQFKYEGQKDNVYTWILDVEGIVKLPTGPGPTPPVTPPTEPVKDVESERLRLQIELEKEKQKTSDINLKKADKIIELVKLGFSREEALKIVGIT